MGKTPPKSNTTQHHAKIQVPILINHCPAEPIWSYPLLNTVDPGQLASYESI